MLIGRETCKERVCNCVFALGTIFFLFFILISELYFIFATTNDAIQCFHEAPFKLVFFVYS